MLPARFGRACKLHSPACQTLAAKVGQEALFEAFRWKWKVRRLSFISVSVPRPKAKQRMKQTRWGLTVEIPLQRSCSRSGSLANTVAEVSRRVRASLGSETAARRSHSALVSRRHGLYKHDGNIYYIYYLLH